MSTTHRPTPDTIDDAGYDDLIDELAAAGYSPIGTLDLPETKTADVVDYFAQRGWDAVRHNGDSLSFVRFSDEGCKILTTTRSGAIAAEASFTPDRFGRRMFTTAAELRP